MDIDPQAVEVTKLSLLLKVLEGESGDALARQMDMFHTRPLPDLGANIKCKFSNRTRLLHSTKCGHFDGEDKLRINAFTWRDAYSFIAEDKGFSAIIGNPPYIFARELMKEHEKEYHRERYRASWDKQNTFMLFMERITQLLRPSGRSSLIVPNSWLTIESAKLLRALYIPRLAAVVDMNYAAFRGVAMEPSIFVSTGDAAQGPVETQTIFNREGLALVSSSTVLREEWQRADGRIFTAGDDNLSKHLVTMQQAAVPIGTAFDVRTGLQAYEKGKGTPPQSAQDVADHVFDRSSREDKNSVQYLQGSDVERYLVNWSGLWMQYGPWLSQPREIGIFSRPRVLIREITGKLPRCIHATYITDKFLNNKSVLNILHDGDDLAELKCLTAVLNSRAFSIFYKARAVKGARTLFPKILINNLRELPYPKSISGAQKAQLAGLVDKLQGDRLKHTLAKGEHERESIRRGAEELDRRIDAIVYQLFGFAQSEVRSLEGMVPVA